MTCPWVDSDWNDRSGPEYRCFVGNLPYGTNERSLLDAFSNYIAWDNEKGRSRGFGFVQFDDEKSMNNAIQGMNGQQVGGRSVTVSKAKPRPRRWRA